MKKDITRICNEQKIIFIKKILLITQQMLTACDSGQFENFDILLHERTDYIRRIEKCDALLQKQVAEEYRNGTDETSSDLSAQNEFRTILQAVLKLNEQIEPRLEDRRKELIAGVIKNPQKSLLRQ